MSILTFISNIFKPASDLIDEIHVSDEERGKLRNEFAKIQSLMHTKSTELMKAEVKSDNMLVAGWRPLTMITLIGLIVLDSFKIITAPEQIYNLFEVFGSAYAGGRSLEKVSKVFKK